MSIHTLIVSAAHRANSQSLRVARALNQHYLGGHADILDLYEHALPLWNGDVQSTPDVEHARSMAEKADAIVFVIPEWHGMAPAGLKNLLLWCGAQQLAHKPVLLVGVSVTAGGAFVIAEMRSSGYKNSRMLYLPEHLILRNVGDLWENGQESENSQYLSKRTGYAIEQLLLYAKVLKPIRGELCAGLTEFANGMS